MSDKKCQPGNMEELIAFTILQEALVTMCVSAERRLCVRRFYTRHVLRRWSVLT